MHIFTSLWMLLLPEMNGICIFRALFTSLECKSIFSFVAVQNWVLEAASFCPKSFNCPSGSDLLTLREWTHKTANKSKAQREWISPELEVCSKHKPTAGHVLLSFKRELGWNPLSRRRASLLKIIPNSSTGTKGSSTAKTPGWYWKGLSGGWHDDCVVLPIASYLLGQFRCWQASYPVQANDHLSFATVNSLCLTK